MHHIQGNHNMIKGEFSPETIKATKKKWDENKTKQENPEPRILYPPKLSFKNKGEIKAFQDMQRLR